MLTLFIIDQNFNKQLHLVDNKNMDTSNNKLSNICWNFN